MCRHTIYYISIPTYHYYYYYYNLFFVDILDVLFFNLTSFEIQC
jgi:hypothetical protein